VGKVGKPAVLTAISDPRRVARNPRHHDLRGALARESGLPSPQPRAKELDEGFTAGRSPPRLAAVRGGSSLQRSRGRAPLWQRTAFIRSGGSPEAARGDSRQRRSSAFRPTASDKRPTRGAGPRRLRRHRTDLRDFPPRRGRMRLESKARAVRAVACRSSRSEASLSRGSALSRRVDVLAVMPETGDMKSRKAGHPGASG
jgi:hypothetical protein